MLGIGVMMRMLGGGHSKSPETYVGRVIAGAELDAGADCFRLSFTDGPKVKLFDDGQSCCENRYMTTDDDVQSLVGGTLLNIEGKKGADSPGGGEVHEACFVEISTDQGFITLTNHNEHNGYYGGFSLSLSEEP